MADTILNKDNVESAELLYAHPEATDEERQRMEIALSTYYANMFNMQPEAIEEKLGNLRYQEITGYGVADDKYMEPESDIGQIVGAIPGALIGETRGARIGGTGGALIGGMLGGPAGAVTGQRVGMIGGAVVGSGLGAFTGGAAGDMTQQLASNALNNRSFSASINQVLQAGGEEAFYDAIGQVMFRGVPGVYRAGKSFLGRGKNESLEELNKILKEKGTYPSLDQMTDNVVITTMGQILRSLPITNRSFQQLDATQAEAFTGYFQQQAKDWADLTTKELTPQGYGRVVASVLKDGENVFNEAMRTSWEQFDELSAKAFNKKKVTVDVYTQYGSRATAKQLKVIPPVDVSTIRKNAAKMLQEAQTVGTVDPNARGIQILKSVASGDNNLTFSQAHSLLSDLKRLQREGRKEGLPANVLLTDLIGDLDQAFNKAGERFEDAGILKLYNNLRRQTKLGKTRFNADFIQEIMEKDKDGTKISTILMQATPEEINQLRKGIYYSDAIAKRAAGTSWKKVQSGYISRFMPTNVLNVDASPIMKIIKSGDQQQIDKLTSVLGKEQADKLVKSFSLINDLRVKPIFGASVGQGMAVAGSIAGVGGAGYLGGMEGAIAATLGPKVLSSIFTSKKMSNKYYNLLTQAKKAEKFSPVNKSNAYIRITRLAYELAQEALSEGD